MDPTYSLWISFKKGIFPAVAAFLVSQLATFDLDAFLATLETLMADPTALWATIKGTAPTLVLAFLVGLVKFVLNMWKQRDLPGNPFYDGDKGNDPQPPYEALIVIMAALSLGLAGCLTTPPALGGKTKYAMEFHDTVSEIKDDAGAVVTPGQDTKFNVTIAAPPGVEVVDLASMRYTVNPITGLVDIAVASDASADTTAQAAALTQAHQATLDTAKELTPVIVNAVANALPGPSTGTRAGDVAPRRTVDVPGLITALQTIGIHITADQAVLLADLLRFDTTEAGR